MVVTGDRLWKHDALVQIGDTIPLPLPIKQSKAYLTKKVFGYDDLMLMQRIITVYMY